MRSLACACAVTLALLALDCKENVRLITPDPSQSPGKVLLILDDAPTEIVRAVARLSRRGADDISLLLMISDSTRSASGTIDNVPVGLWHLRVDAFNDSNIVRYAGEADVEVFPGETSDVDLTLLPASGSVEIHVTWGGGLATTGLMLYLKFDGTLEDSSGNGNHGSSNNPTYTSDAWGNPNSAYLFNGANNYVTVANSPTINPVRQLTITLWLRVDSIQSNYMPILVKGGPVSGYFNNREYGVWSKQDNTSWFPQFKSAGDGGGMHELDSDFRSYVVGKWTFFTFVVDRVRHRMEIYADGVRTHQTGDLYSTFNINPYPLIIGWSEENLPEHSPLRGAMDNLRIYNRALSPTQIRELYTSRE